MIVLNCITLKTNCSISLLISFVKLCLRNKEIFAFEMSLYLYANILVAFLMYTRLLVLEFFNLQNNSTK